MRNSWFSQGLIKPAQPIKAINLPGDHGVGHQWSYLPDVARTMVELLARLIAALGHEPHTPLDDSIEATLKGLGCLTS